MLSLLQVANQRSNNDGCGDAKTDLDTSGDPAQLIIARVRVDARGVGRCEERLEKCGIALSQGLGRHRLYDLHAELLVAMFLLLL